VQVTSGVTTRRQSQEEAQKEVESNVEDMETSAQAAKASTTVKAAAGTKHAASRTKKPVAGFTRTLISKSETGAHLLARRTERLQLEGSDTLIVDDDMEVCLQYPQEGQPPDVAGDSHPIKVLLD
jgi:hypothetical protein